MAKQKTKKEVVATKKVETEMYSAEECKRYIEFDVRVNTALRMADKSMIELGGALAVIANEKLFRVDGYKSINQYAVERYGISKATASDSINTFIAFGDLETGELQLEYMDYTFSQLKLMRRLKDLIPLEDFEQITPDITARELQAMINEAKNPRLETSEEEEPENTTEENQSEDNTAEVEPTRVENSGNVEPYVEMVYTMEEWENMDAETIKNAILGAFKAGHKAILNYK